jgi:CHAT domain-containing protein
MELRQAPLTPADEDAAKQQQAKLDELAQLSAEQEVILREIALRREPCKLLFPPIRSTKTVQETLPKGHGLLAFFSTSRHAYAFLMTSDKYGYWAVKSSPKTFVRKVQSMLQKWGNFEQNKELKPEELADDGWKTPAKEIMELLTADSKAELGGGMFQELAIVPDGLLWYVPFEALQVPDGDGTASLISKIRIRYAPTVGLAIGDPRRRRQGLNTAVALGKLFPRDEDEVALDAFNDLSRVVPGALSISKELPAPSSIFGCLFDRLVVYGEIAPGNADPYGWSPLKFNHGKKADSALAQWLMLPWGGPDEIILPGFRTSAEHAAKGLLPEQAANEIFLTLCGMMSTGARTVLMSRWRPGGQSSYDLTREFVQELPEMTAADAWQRSVELVSRMPLDPTMEPRVKAGGQDDPPRAENPFFWAGFLLADTGSLPRGSEPEEPMEAAPLAIQPIGAAVAQKPDAGEMKPDADNKPAAADDPVGAGLGLRRQPDRAKARGAKGPGAMPGMPAADGAAAADQPPPGIAPGGPVLDGEFGPGSKKKRSQAKPERKKPATRGKRLKERLKVES